MEEAFRLREEIARLQEAIQEHQRQLLDLQKSCTHQFQESSLARTCVKCSLTESLYY
ncbi:hypothetical protein [Brevibacillus choshinensis]|uniref:Uncharacterized protein n=1 Tax=Brevibacillus choshinensis TaxID=54911 RepID=A0ABX7FKN4_BRECH|nr:hypothetical protein [Brevibacillus choshinensis]QRG65560.1 hypothetical protein JNE38_18265 [Brevibacillus choshinensis]